jgi:hypothetical protein
MDNYDEQVDQFLVQYGLPAAIEGRNATEYTDAPQLSPEPAAQPAAEHTEAPPAPEHPHPAQEQAQPPLEHAHAHAPEHAQPPLEHDQPAAGEHASPVGDAALPAVQLAAHVVCFTFFKYLCVSYMAVI